MMRKKKRYILVYLESGYADDKELIRATRARIVDLFGAIGLQSINLKIMKIEPNFFILRCNHDRTDDLLFTISSMKFKDSALLPLRVSGTMKKLKGIISDFSQIARHPP
ncbi:MAG: hypothetical protein H3Z50_03475 [archaeon]|nr:hypothetical protein [archaeon]MCP8306628.1 hypothetical protein [archaeon]